MASSTPLLVTGASGQLGRRVLELLLEAKVGPIIATTRKPESLAAFAARGVEVRRADFDSPSGLVAAFRGAQRALLISTDALDQPGRRVAQHQVAIKALQEAGVRHVVYTSLPNPEGSPIAVAPDHEKTEAALKASTLDYTFLRNNLYIDLSLGAFAGAVATGQLVDAKPSGKISYVTREDCARAAAAALASNSSGRTSYDITGPESLTSDQVAAALSEVTGKKVIHLAVPVPAYIDGLVKHGVPKVFAEVLASFDVGAERGDLAHASDAVKQLTGRPAQSLREFLTANRAALKA